MTNIHRTNPYVKQKLQPYIDSANAEKLLVALGSLSVSEFRTAGYLLAEDLLPQLRDEDFWTFFKALASANAKAYLGTCLKAATILYKQKKISFNVPVLTHISLTGTPIDTRKTLDAFLPIARTADEVETLLRVFSCLDAEKAAPALHRAGTVQTYYVLFKLMKTADSRPDLLKQNVLALMKKGDKLSFNLASIMCQYFDLRDIPGRFSLRLQPYELSRLDSGIENFMKMILR